ncbi:glycosyl transferase group 1 [Peptoclostridium acidaminophilum DSM 3953]|uniref:Glycosyl transferase group 1 n=1 Tax=Peptoclostridium acidaminophilum DSM 3953 TaxID=1286171 RepID=W8THI4_PEPAC|nr:CatB-related O-acetyltransferase [Peptoclostridium acidaminophilum]AHM57293.1 glycosyl transferase group 1 [Peptoclostridium acidaminophilum DSM 3953]
MLMTFLLYIISKFIKKMHIPAIKDSNIDKTAKICSGSQIEKTHIGKYSYIGNFCTVVNAEIGNFSSIADDCIIGGASHPVEWVSTSPVFHDGKNIMQKNFSVHEYNTSKKTIIGHDVWIGNKCLIKSGVKIENGAIIGMGSVLTKNVGRYEIWGGNPAKFIRKRLSDDLIEKLHETNWWDFSDAQISEYAETFLNVENFLKQVVKE